VLSLLVRYVFKSERKRVFRYLRAIEAAKSHGKSPSQITEWLHESGGIDEVSKRIKVMDRSKEHQALDAEAQTIRQLMKAYSSDPLALISISGNPAKENMVLLTYPAANGSLKVVAVIHASERLIDALIRQQAAKNLKDKITMASMSQEAQKFITRAHSNDGQMLKVA
jgi:hypothetical protein